MGLGKREKKMNPFTGKSSFLYFLQEEAVYVIYERDSQFLMVITLQKID